MRMRTEKETEIAMLDANRGIVEALASIGGLNEEELRGFEARRAAAGARPLELTMRRFDPATVTPTPELDAAAIRALRKREGTSQAVFARYLGVATTTLSQWERGVRRPDGPALRLMGLAERHGLDHIR